MLLKKWARGNLTTRGNRSMEERGKFQIRVNELEEKV